MSYKHYFSLNGDLLPLIVQLAETIAEREETVCHLQGENAENERPIHYNDYSFILGWGVSKSLTAESYAIDPFDQLENMTTGRWYFHRFGYGLASATMHENIQQTGMDGLFSFEAANIISVRQKKIEVLSDNYDEEDFLEMLHLAKLSANTTPLAPPLLECTWQRNEYLDTIDKLQSHITEGDVYEINLCLEHLATLQNWNAYAWWQYKVSHSAQPFGGYFKQNGIEICCASMERFFLHIPNEQLLISQPIKGTAKITDPAILEETKAALGANEKERTENIMIVDLTRNDLSRICAPGSVLVSELCGVYAFPTVLQMISTVVGEPKAGTTFEKVLKAMYPMGSMTGAPKSSAVTLIDKYEKSPRGFYSGSIGYTNPEGRSDLNVVIRSLIYEKELGRLSTHAGGAITIDSVAEDEWEEIQLKLKYWLA